MWKRATTLKNRAKPKSHTSRAIKIIIMGKILIQFTFPNMGKEVYDKVVKDLAAAGHGNIPERLYHATAPIGKDWHVTDVWESEEAFNKFGEIMVPILEKNGGTPVPPKVMQVYNIIVPE